VNLQLEIEGEGLKYLPGQYMNVLLEDGTHRSFSMASAPAGNLVDFHVRQIPGGRFTESGLKRLAAGDRLDVEIPVGTFRLHAEDYRPLVMVATGTGLAPIKSMLESLMDDADCPPVSLYWGVRTEADLYLAHEIRGWGERLYEFDFVPVLSRPDAAWPGRRGHVQDAVAEDFGDLSEHALYLCGSPAMIGEAKHRFLGLGASADHVYVDGFTFQHALA
jgi:CDP-4-dehydro-6-deoxyglucose reductase